MFGEQKEFFGKEIECKFLFDTIGIEYDYKVHKNIWREIKSITYNYNIYIKDTFKYEQFWNHLYLLAKGEQIELYLKMRYERFKNIGSYVDFPETLTGEGYHDMPDEPIEWIHFYLYAEISV